MSEDRPVRREPARPPPTETSDPTRNPAGEPPADPAYHPSPAALEEEARQGWSSWAKWSAVGFEFAASVGLFFLLGSYLDATWGTQPWMRVVGAGVGIVLGMYVLIQKALTEASDDRSEGPPRPEN